MSLLLLFGGGGGGGGGGGSPIGLLLSLTYSSGTTPPPPPPAVGRWSPVRPWKPSKRTEREIEELLEEIREKAERLKPKQRIALERQADEVSAAIELLIADAEAKEAEVQTMRLVGLLRSIVAAESIAKTLEIGRRAEQMAIAVQLEIDDEEEAFIALLH